MSIEATPAEQSPGAASIFPFTFEDLAQLHTALAAPPTIEFQKGIVELREEGAADDMLTTIYGAHFDAWHTGQDRLPADSPEDALVYKIAQLYGLRLSSDRYYALTGDRLQPDDPDAYDVARQAVLNSYTARPAPFPLNDWEIETWRESVHGQAAFLGAALGFAYEQLMQHYSVLFNTSLSISENRIYTALYRGMLDSAIFFNTYLRAKQGLPVEQFEGLTYHESPSPDPSELAVGETGYYFPEDSGAIRSMAIRPDETPEMFFANSAEPTIEAMVVIGDYVFEAERIVTQIGPHEYRIGYKLKRLTAEAPPMVRSNFQRALGFSGVTSLVSMVSAGAIEALSPDATGRSIAEAASVGSVAGVLFGAVGGLLLALRRRRAT